MTKVPSMPKSIPVDPQAFQMAGELAFPRVPLHAYSRSFAEELASRGPKAMTDILRHMGPKEVQDIGLAMTGVELE